MKLMIPVRESAGARLGRSTLRRAAVALFVVAGPLLLAACDFGPSGPGSLTGRATGDGLGAVLLEVEGSGIQGFSGRGSTQVYSGDVPDQADTYRVILVDPAGGELGFDIEVDDLGMEGPIVTVVQATSTGNALVPTSGVSVSIER